jgi:hypothetical protein
MSRLRLVAAQGSYKKATRLDRCTQRAKSTSNQASRSLAISGRGFRSSWQQVTFKSGDRKTLRRQPIEQCLYLLDDRQHVPYRQQEQSHGGDGRIPWLCRLLAAIQQ